MSKLTLEVTIEPSAGWDRDYWYNALQWVASGLTEREPPVRSGRGAFKRRGSFRFSGKDHVERVVTFEVRP